MTVASCEPFALLHTIIATMSPNPYKAPRHVETLESAKQMTQRRSHVFKTMPFIVPFVAQASYLAVNEVIGPLEYPSCQIAICCSVVIGTMCFISYVRRNRDVSLRHIALTALVYTGICFVLLCLFTFFFAVYVSHHPVLY